jgi:hypothetical protein
MPGPEAGGCRPRAPAVHRLRGARQDHGGFSHERVDDAEFEIQCNSAEGGDYTQVFTSVDIVGRNATLKLTHH